MDIFYPKRCPVCHETLKISEGLVHSCCLGKLNYVQGPTCFRCGKPILSNDEAYCSDCDGRTHHFDSGKSVWVYDRLMQQSISTYKYKDARVYAQFYVQQMIEVHGPWIRFIRPDVIIPVPIHWKKRQQRGFNQAGLLAKMLGRQMDILVDEGYLVRKASTAPQKSLTPIQRYVNLRNAFSVRKTNKLYTSILLVDDIYTTGSTIDACAAVLKAAGAKRVYYISLCIGSDHGG